MNTDFGQWPPIEGIWADPHSGKGAWDQPGLRRTGLRQLHRWHRYGSVLRAPRTRPLDYAPATDGRTSTSLNQLAERNDFVGLIALQKDRVYVERYAADFDGHQIHSIQSISKTLVNLIAGQCVADGVLDLHTVVEQYVPEIGSGYQKATISQLLDMNVVNDYSEDYTDPNASVGQLECAHGWRIDTQDTKQSLRSFLTGIEGTADRSPDGVIQYKTANTDLAAWVCERASGKALHALLVSLIESAGTAEPVFLSTDRHGVPFLGGGLHTTLPDLARLGRLFCADTNSTAAQGLLKETMDAPHLGTLYPDGTYYRNGLESDGSFIGHQGYGGQYLYVEPLANIVVAVFSALESVDGFDYDYIVEVRDCCRSLAATIRNQL